MRDLQITDSAYRTFETVAQRDSYLGDKYEGMQCLVYGDPSPANNGYYILQSNLTTWDTLGVGGLRTDLFPTNAVTADGELLSDSGFSFKPVSRPYVFINGVNYNVKYRTEYGTLIQDTDDVTGDDMPNTTVNDIYYSPGLNKTYFATESGLWINDNNSYTLITTGTSVLGTALPQNDIEKLAEFNSTIYVAINDAVNGGIWYWNELTNTGTLLNTSYSPTSGPNLPTNEVKDISFDVTRNLIVVATNSGIWTLDLGTDTSVLYNTAFTPGSGDQIASNTIDVVIADGTYIWGVVSSTDIWRYDISNDIGLNIDDNTIVTGDSMPAPAGMNNLSLDIDHKRGFLYLGFSSGLWEYDYINGLATLYTTLYSPASGSAPTSNSVTRIKKNSNTNILIALTANEIWILNKELDNGTNINTGSSLVSGVPFSVLPAEIEINEKRNSIETASTGEYWIYDFLIINDLRIVSPNLTTFREDDEWEKGDKILFYPSSANFDLEEDDVIIIQYFS